MYRLACKSREIEAACRKPSCVFPDICDNLGTDHTLARRAVPQGARAPGREADLRSRRACATTSRCARRSGSRELAQHHTGGYLKIAPEHTEEGPLAHMMKPGIGAYDRFKELFDRYSQEAGKEQYLIPYFIAAHPGTTDEDMLDLALWLKRNGFRPDQVQAFLPSPMASATAMYHTGYNPLRSLKAQGARARRRRASSAAASTRRSCAITIRTTGRCCARRCAGWAASDLIGGGKHHLVPSWQPAGTGDAREGRRGSSGFSRALR